MPDKELVETVLQAVKAQRPIRENCGHRDDDCAVPDFVFYFIFCDCTTINNGACEDWKFCDPCRDRHHD
ncbi:MAG TPA: hypothetical protein GXX23_08350 [Firmicutes bacterium]|nr:hypothetical protein [Candidatus Fermentithermobacillaceae bacterium]